MEAKRGHITPTNWSHQVTVEEVLQSTPRAIRRAGCPRAEWLGGAPTKVESKMAPCQGVPGSYPAGTGKAGWLGHLAGQWPPGGLPEGSEQWHCRMVRRSPISSFLDTRGITRHLPVKGTGHQDLGLWGCPSILWPVSGTPPGAGMKMGWGGWERGGVCEGGGRRGGVRMGVAGCRRIGMGFVLTGWWGQSGADARGIRRWGGGRSWRG